MIADADGTILALRNISALMTNDTSGIAFLVYKNSNLLSLLKIFFYALKRQLGKIGSNLLGHIHQKNRFFGILCIVIKTFVIHKQKIPEDEADDYRK